MAELNPTAFQASVLSVPESISLFLGGGRGGGKSWAMGLLILRHIELYREQARVLYVRRSFPGVRDFELVLRQLFSVAYGQAAQYNASDHVWRLPYGYVELGCLDGPGAYDRFQGRSFTLVVVDELTQFPEPAPIDMLRSNLRAPEGIPTRTILAGNPGGPGHSWVAQRYVFRSQPWQGFDAEGVRFIRAVSTYQDNPHLDRVDYERQLQAACTGDPELFKAWTTGDWSVARGAFFAGILNEKHVAVPKWEFIPRGWKTFLAHDFGSSAPSVTYLMARSQGEQGGDGNFYPRGSLIALDEIATSRPGRPSEGLGWTVPRIAESIRDMCTQWNVPLRGCADDACFARSRGFNAPSLADEFSACRVYFQPAGKGSRKAGWERMRILLSQAGKPDLPGLYIARNCTYAWETLPSLPRDPRNHEDVDSSAPDHAADALRYACIWKPASTRQVAL